MLFGPATLIDKSIIYPEGDTLCETQFHARLNCEKINISFSGRSGGVGPDQIEFVVWGSKFSYRLWDWYNLQSTTGQDWKSELVELSDPRRDCYMNTLNHLSCMVKNETNNMASLRAGLSVQKIIEEILILKNT